MYYWTPKRIKELQGERAQAKVYDVERSERASERASKRTSAQASDERASKQR